MKPIHEICFGVIPSTADYVRDHLDVFNPNSLTCVTATGQTAGRGRKGDRWISPEGVNLYMTLFITMSADLKELSQLANLVSLSTLVALEKFGKRVKLKAPNDLFLDGGKVGGVLVETFPLGERRAVSLSLGLNIHMKPEDLAKIDQKATTLDPKGEFTIEQIRATIVHQLKHDLEIFELRGFSAFATLYKEHLQTNT